MIREKNIYNDKDIIYFNSQELHKLQNCSGSEEEITTESVNNDFVCLQSNDKLTYLNPSLSLEPNQIKI